MTESKQTDQIAMLKAERNVFQGKYRSMAALMEDARSKIRQVSDHTEDEGDRVYFGSSNHADWLQDLADDMESWLIDFMLPKGDINKMERDPYAEIGRLRLQLERVQEEANELVVRQYEVSAQQAKIIKLSDALANLVDFCERMNWGGGIISGRLLDEAHSALDFASPPTREEGVRDDV